MSRQVSNMFCVDGSKGYTMCLSDNGDVYCFGNMNPFETEDSTSSKIIIPAIQNIRSINSGKFHNVCLDVNGCLYTFGMNDKGQLGVGTPSFMKSVFNSLKYWLGGTPKSSFIKELQLVQLPPIKQVSCGREFTVCLTEEGELYSFGLHGIVQLGIGRGEKLYYDFPQKIPNLKDVEFVECGGGHTVCKTKNNEIYVWGNNNAGQLGITGVLLPCSPQLCKDWPDNVADVKCGDAHTLVLTSDGDVYSCGYNSYGQTGRICKSSSNAITLKKIDELSRIIRIECGYNHSMCIDSNNDLFVFGCNQSGQLGLGTRYDIKTPIKHPTLSNIIDISSGGEHTFVKTSNNEIYAFGKNDCSQLGIESSNEFKSRPTRVFESNEDIWCSNINSSQLRFKSARK